MAEAQPDESSAFVGQPTATQVFVQLGGAALVDDATCDDVVEKLKLLNYETNFCPTGKPPFRLLSKSYFTAQADTGNLQFYYFTSLVSWLMSVAGHNFTAPGQFDDPNATSTNILQEMKALGLPTKDLAPTRIRQGHGEAVLTILTLLTDKALMSKNFAFAPIVYPAEKAEPEAVSTDENARSVVQGGDDIADNVDVDSDSGDELYVGPASKRQAEHGAEMIVSQVSTEEWALEVERVGPMLQYHSDELRDWRARLENAGTLYKAVEKMYPDVKAMLERMGDDLAKSVERIQKREQTLSQQFHEHVEEYRLKLRDLNGTQDSNNQANQNVTQLSNELNQVSELLDHVKESIADREGKISDTAPLMSIKDAVAKIRSEIKEMSLRIGILQHTVMHYNLRQTKEKREGQSPTDLEESDHDASFL